MVTSFIAALVKSAKEQIVNTTCPRNCTVRACTLEKRLLIFLVMNLVDDLLIYIYICIIVGKLYYICIYIIIHIHMHYLWHTILYMYMIHIICVYIM